MSAAAAAIAGTPSVALAGGMRQLAQRPRQRWLRDPGVPAGTYAIYDAALVPPWSTTDVANGIEIWGDGFNGVPAFEGANFAELNANSAGTLYQDVVSTPGSTMTWTLQHRAREGTDVMRVLIGDATTADVFSDTGWDVISADISHDTTAWGSHPRTTSSPPARPVRDSRSAPSRPAPATRASEISSTPSGSR